MAKYINEFPQHFDDNGNPLAFFNVFFGLPNQDPKTNPKAPFSDKALTVPIATTQVLDATGSYGSDIFLDDKYSIRIESSGGSLFRESPSITGLIDVDDFNQAPVFTSFAGAFAVDQTGFNIIETTSFFLVANASDSRGGSSYGRDGTTGTASTAYSDNSGFFDVAGDGFSIILNESRDMWEFGGVSDGATDNTAIFTNIVSLMPNGGTIRFGEGSWKGNFITTQHNLILQGDGPKATTLLTNSVVSGDFVIDIDIGAQATAKLPQSTIIRDMTVVGDINNGVKGINYGGTKAGGIYNVEINSVAVALKLRENFNSDFNNFFIRNYDVGLSATAGSETSNNNSFRNWIFFGGNAANNAIPIDTLGGLSQNHFEEIIFQGSRQQGTTNLDGGNFNTFLNCRWESCTPQGSTTPYIILGGVGNNLITPTVTLNSTFDLLAFPAYLIDVIGDACIIQDLAMTVPIRHVQLTAASKNCRVSLDTTNIANITPNSIVMDYGLQGSQNEIVYNGMDEMQNNEYTCSQATIQNLLIESTDLSAVVTDGLSQSTASLANSQDGPFQEGLIEQFDTPVGNSRFTQDIITETSIVSNGVYAYSYWALSLTPGGEDVGILLDRTLVAAEASITNIFVPSTHYVRVVQYFKADTSAYANFFAGNKLPLTSSGIRIYGRQFKLLGQLSAGLLPPLFPGAFVPTEDVINTKQSPCYARNREHKISPVRGLGTFGSKVGRIKPTVGQSKGFWLTAIGGAGTWTSVGNL